MVKYERKPKEIRIAVPNGNYEVALDITAHTDAVYTVYCQNRRFVAVDRQISAGETQRLTFAVNVCDYIRRDAAHAVDGIQISIVCDRELSVVSQHAPVNVPTLYLIGDSTVTDQPAEYPYDPQKTYCGWGQVPFIDLWTATGPACAMLMDTMKTGHFMSLHMRFRIKCSSLQKIPT